jgi:predicted phage terminase large subunit-like protein
VKVNKVMVDKVTRAKPVSSQCERGNVIVCEGKWNEAFFNELEAFPPSKGGHDDIVDTLSGSFNMIVGSTYSLSDFVKM